MKFQVAMLSAVMLSATAVLAGKARIDINPEWGKPASVELKPGPPPVGGVCINQNWGKGYQREFGIYFQTGALPADQWTTFTLSFLPSADGKVVIAIKGDYRKASGKKDIDQNWVYFDQIRVEGATLRNGNFADLNADGKPKSWWGKGLVVDGKAHGASSARCAKVWHNALLDQHIQVTKGQEVKITFSAKSGESLPAAK